MTSQTFIQEWYSQKKKKKSVSKECYCCCSQTGRKAVELCTLFSVQQSSQSFLSWKKCGSVSQALLPELSSVMVSCPSSNMASILSRSLQPGLIWSWGIHMIKPLPWQCPLDKWSGDTGHVSDVDWLITDICLSLLTLISDLILGLVQYQMSREPSGSVSASGSVFIAKLRGKVKNRGKNSDECLFLLKKTDGQRTARGDQTDRTGWIPPQWAHGLR